MTSPDILAQGLLSTEEISENKHNGYGYWMYSPELPSSFADALPKLREYGGFIELPAIVDELNDTKKVLLIGEPGSGKSHLVRDLQVDCVINKVPAFCLTVQINAGKRDGLGNIKQQLEAFRSSSRRAGGGLLVLDNIDYIGYKGGSRKLSITEQYARDFKSTLESLAEDEDLHILGTAHDESWREGRWTWRNEVVDGAAKGALELFPSKLVFEGKMALEGLAQILLSRAPKTDENANTISKVDKVSIGDATRVMINLKAMNRDNFFHANHIEINKFLKDPNAAIEEIDLGRQQRRGKA